MFTVQEYYFVSESNMNTALLNNQKGKLLKTGIHPELNIPFADIEWNTLEDMVDWVSRNEALFHNENQ